MLIFFKTQAFNLFLHRYHFRTLLQSQSPFFTANYVQARGHSSYFFSFSTKIWCFLWGTLFNMAENQHFPYETVIYCAFFSKIISNILCFRISVVSNTMWIFALNRVRNIRKIENFRKVEISVQ